MAELNGTTYRDAPMRSPTRHFLFLRIFNVFVDCRRMIRTVIPSQFQPTGSPMPKLTKRRIDAAETMEKKYFIWDDALPGFGLRVLPSGRKSYIVQYRAGRRARRMSLGPNTVLACEQARGQAITILAAVRKGEDPSADRAAHRSALNMTELAERFDAEHISVRLKESTATEYRRNLRRFILPALGRLIVAEVTRADISKFHHDLRHIPYQANRCLEVLSKMFNLAEMWGLRPDGSNPRKHIRKYPEEKRERFLSTAELRRIGEVLREMEIEGIELPSAILAARLLILTGCRLGEIMTLKWEFLDLPEKVLRLPDSKTGAKLVHLGQPAVELLAGVRPVKDNLYVIAGTIKGKHLSDLQPFWQRVRARTGLKDVRIHDLRHTFASTAVASGQGLPMIGKLLGHTQVQTTARYAHLAAEPVRNAADMIATSLQDALG
jgi:integrase